jgi:hypothetical protein
MEGVMRVLGPGGPLLAVRQPEAGRAGPGAPFPPPAAGASPGAAAGIAAMPALASLEAVLALQAVTDAMERKRRALRRGHDLLDRLDALHAAVLDGDLSAADPDGLRRALARPVELPEEPGLAAALREIEQRALVELAKLERSGSRT